MRKTSTIFLAEKPSQIVSDEYTLLNIFGYFGETLKSFDREIDLNNQI
jgi:hypothetical protein